MKVLTSFFLSLAFAFTLSAQDCQLVAMQVDIPAGISKHHFPLQALPMTDAQNYFTYLAKWDESDLVIRIRFSEDSEEWTDWQILKRDFRDPNSTSSLLNLGESNYEFFEWAVFNKGGSESQLTFNFFHPTQDIIIADNSEFEFEVTPCQCPEPEIVPVTNTTSVVTIGADIEE